MMGVRRFRSCSIAALCALASVFVIVAAPASAATRFGEGGETLAEAEKTHSPVGVAVDATGDVYAGDFLNNRLDKFGGAGEWQWAAGVGVFDAAPEMELCTTSCLEGRQVGSASALELPTGVAVDTDTLSNSYGDAYIVDEGHSRVEKFDPEGKFILMFGGKVNAEASPANPDVCTASEKCNSHAATGAEDGEFSSMEAYGFSSFIGVGPGGAVYVGDKARVEVFEPTGAWKENISLAGLSTEARPTALAVDNSGDVFVSDAGVAGVREFEPNGKEKSVQFDARSTSVTAIALDSSGHVFVGDSSGEFHVLEYDAGGKELASFAKGTVTGQNGGLAFSGAAGEIYASEAHIGYGEAPQSSIWAIPVPAAGPIVDSQSATPELRGAATLQALVNAEGAEATAYFEYVDETHFHESGYASAISTAPATIGSGFEDQSVSAHPTLVPGTVYHYRVIARSAQGITTGEDQTFQEISPALITGPWATDVAGTSVTLNAKINPLGASTTYRLEYGASASYGHAVSGNVGEGMSDVTISHHLQGLDPTTEYHYRVVTSNEVGEWQSPDRTFTTQGAGSELTLPDGRVWELVSPANKHGALINPELAELHSFIMQAAADGSGVAYAASSPVSEAPSGNHDYGDQIVSVRGPDGWRTQEVEAAQRLSGKEGEGHPPFLFGTHARVFSSDLSQVLIEPDNEDVEPLTPEFPGAPQATERTLYVRDDATGMYLPLVTPANVPSGTKFGGEAGGYSGSEGQMQFRYATPDMSHVVFQSPFRLTPEAVEGPGVCVVVEKGGGSCPMNLYEWSGGRLSLVDVLPDGKPLVGVEGDGAYLGRANYDVIGAVSNDGRWIVWSHGNARTERAYPLYVRDMAAETTWQIGGERPQFDTMSSNGAWVFYWEGQELYAYDVRTHATTDVTANHGPGELKAGVKDGFDMGVSEDGTYMYFVATGVLAPGAVHGEDNLYVSHYDGASWRSPKLIATLSKADEASDLVDGTNPSIVHWELNYARVSPNGRYLTFMSSRSLTGYDNTDVSERETEDRIGGPGEVVMTRVHHDEEVYLYDVLTGRLSCVSCSLTGERPSGEVASPYSGWSHRWLAATLPRWNTVSIGAGAGTGAMPPQLHYLSNDGRVFFDSAEALVPQDANGVADIYEYEPAGAGSCTGASLTFNERSGGCTSLISSGTSGGASAFLDASETGNDVFFVTSSKLVEEDYDTAYDVYDAHVCSSSVPCRAASVSPPACTSGDSCKPAPAPQPEIFGPAPSATFSGVGNISQEAKSIAKRSRKLKRPVKKRRHKARHTRGAKRKLRGRARSHASRIGTVTGRGK